MGETSKPAFPSRLYMTRSGAGSAGGGASSTGLKGVVAGGIAGGLEILITYPTEYVKTQLQLDEKGARRFAGPVDCLFKTLKEHGPLGLYRGLSVLLVGSVPKSAVRFGAFETVKKYLAGDQGSLSAGQRLLSGLVAGVCEAVVAVTPMETIKVKFINDRRSPSPRFKGFFQGISLILKEQGLRGLYQGVTPTVIKQGSNQAIRFYVMETLKHAYAKGDPDVKIPKYMVGIFGVVAGAASVYGNNPIDVVKTRMQGLEAAKYKNTLDCIRKILVNEGIAGFYKGTVPRLSRVCLDVPISFMIYESFIELFNKIWP